MKQFLGVIVLLTAVGGGVAIHQVARARGTFQADRPTQQTSGKLDAPPLERITNATSTLVRLAEANADGAARDRATHLLAEIETALTALERDDPGSEAEIRQGRRATLIARYAAATIDPSRLAQPFQEFAQAFIAAYPDSQASRQAKMLQILARHDLSRPVEEKLFKDIKAFAARHTPKQGAALYCLAAQELAKRQQGDVAKSLLQRGIKSYPSAPTALAMLVNQSADLGLSQAPPPRYSDDRVNSMMASFEARAKAAAAKMRANPNSCSPRRT